jgi:hypothetical protein
MAEAARDYWCLARPDPRLWTERISAWLRVRLSKKVSLRQFENPVQCSQERSWSFVGKCNRVRLKSPISNKSLPDGDNWTVGATLASTIGQELYGVIGKRVAEYDGIEIFALHDAERLFEISRRGDREPRLV